MGWPNKGWKIQIHNTSTKIILIFLTGCVVLPESTPLRLDSVL